MYIKAFLLIHLLLLMSPSIRAAVAHASYLSSISIQSERQYEAAETITHSMGSQTEPVSMASWLLNGVKSGSDSRCPICLETTLSLDSGIEYDSDQRIAGGLLVKQLCDCRPKYHIGCLLRIKSCPTCRKEHSISFRQELRMLARLQRNALEKDPQQSVIPSFFGEIETLRQQDEKLKLLLSHSFTCTNSTTATSNSKEKRKRRNKNEALIASFKRQRDRVFEVACDSRRNKRLRQARDLVDTMLAALTAVHSTKQGPQKMQKIVESGWMVLLRNSQEEFEKEQDERRQLAQRCYMLEQRLQKLHRLTRQEDLL